MGKTLTMIAALLMLVGCYGQTPQEMAATAKACRDGGFEVAVMENLTTGERYVRCGAYVGSQEQPTNDR